MEDANVRLKVRSLALQPAAAQPLVYSYDKVSRQSLGFRKLCYSVSIVRNVYTGSKHIIVELLHGMFVQQCQV
jgi:hypothetical protein